jgi:hypothetical protein
LEYSQTESQFQFDVDFIEDLEVESTSHNSKQDKKIFEREDRWQQDDIRAMAWERKAQQSLLLNNNSNTVANNNNNDRFIPNRSGMEKVLEQSTLEENENDISELDKSIHIKVLANNSGFIENYSNTRVLAFKNKAPAPKDGYQSSLKVLYSQQTTKKAEVVKPTRQISSTPLRILDAPDLKDDYYLNLMSWSAGNVLAVALSSTLYLWDAASGDIKELTTLQSGDSEEYISDENILLKSHVRKRGSEEISADDQTVKANNSAVNVSSGDPDMSKIERAGPLTFDPCPDSKHKDQHIHIPSDKQQSSCSGIIA